MNSGGGTEKEEERGKEPGLTAGDGCIRFVSDLHLGHERSLIADPCQIGFLLDGCSTLVVCGDMAETRACPFQEEGMRQKNIFEEMCRDVGVNLISLSGNHDPEQEEDTRTFCEGKVLGFHGHCLFREVAPWGWEYLRNKKLCRDVIARYPSAESDLNARMELARTMSLCVPPILRNSTGKQKSISESLKHICWPPERPLSILRAWLTMGARIHKFGKRFFPQAQLICYGHFHRRHISRRGTTYAVNLGALFKHATAYAVDVRRDEAVIREISPAGFGKMVKRISLR